MKPMRKLQKEHHSEGLNPPTPEEQALFSGNVTHMERRAGGVQFVELDNGETGLFWPNGVRARRLERAAYLVDGSWNFGLVPPTVIREFPGEYVDKVQGDFQEYVPDATDARKVDGIENDERFQGDLYKLWILNYSTWDTDGHKGNVIVTDKIHSIDHQYAFVDHDERSRHSFREFFGEQAPEEVIKEADGFLKDDVRQQVLLEQLEGLMSKRDAEACLARMRHIAMILTTKGKIDSEEELDQYSPS